MTSVGIEIISQDGNMEKTYKQIEKEYGKNVIPLFKCSPPFQRYKDGYGFLGVLLWDAIEDKLQCHICGKWFKAICSLHLKKHNLTPVEYKKIVGLGVTTPMWSENTMKKRRKYLKESFEKHRNFFEARKNNNKKKLMADFGRKGGNVRKKIISEQEKNMFGTCDAQLKARFIDLYKKLKRLPSYHEFTWSRTLARRYGSYNNAVRSFGFIPRIAKK